MVQIPIEAMDLKEKYSRLPSNNRMVLKVKNKEEFDRLINTPDKLVIVEFYAPWCGPCRMIGPKVDKLADELPDILFVKVDVDDASCEEVIEDYDIKVMPTFYFIKNGETIALHEGNNYDALVEVVNEHK
uniref:Thioredoxin domain-containing protein n=1 Tax=Romanomermis culicivorax TaxID=13658 RepID=A0A915JBA6_ROMCU